MPSPSELIIRPARPEDVQQAIPLIYSAGPKAFDYFFGVAGRNTQDQIRRLYLDGRGLFGYRTHFVAELDGRVVGTIAIYCGGAEYKKLLNGLVLQILASYHVLAPVVFYRSTHLARIAPAPRESTDYVADLGVSPELRNRGVGRALLDFGLARARERGKTRYALDVAITNPRAQALYERFGMKMKREMPFPGPGDLVPGSRRMEMAVA